MCWASPAVIINVNTDMQIAKVDFGDGILRDAVIGIDESRISKGDIVMVHAGVIITVLDFNDVIEQVNTIKEFYGEDSRELYEVYLNLLSLAQSLKSGGVKS